MDPAPGISSPSTPLSASAPGDATAKASESDQGKPCEGALEASDGSPRGKRAAIPYVVAIRRPGYAEALNRDCPTCYARAGLLCRNHKTGKGFAFHSYRWEYDDCMAVECPVCASLPGELCTTLDKSKSFGFHRERLLMGRAHRAYLKQEVA